MPLLAVIGDADSIPIQHVADLQRLLGGGTRDGSWDRSGVIASKVAVLPDATHYDILDHSLLPQVAATFLDA